MVVDYAVWHFRGICLTGHFLIMSLHTIAVQYKDVYSGQLTTFSDYDPNA